MAMTVDANVDSLNKQKAIEKEKALIENVMLEEAIAFQKAKELKHNTQFTSDQQEESLLSLGTTLERLNDMQRALSQSLAQNAAHLTDSQIQTFKDGMEANNATIAAAIESAVHSGNVLGNNVKTASNNLVNQMVITDVLENEVHNAEMAYADLKQNNIDKLRMLDINTYYTEKYKAQTDLMKLIIYFTIPLLILAILNNKRIIGKNLVYILGGIILLVGVICVLMMLYDINNRDPMNFREYKVSVNTDDIDLKFKDS